MNNFKFTNSLMSLGALLGAIALSGCGSSGTNTTIQGLGGPTGQGGGGCMPINQLITGQSQQATIIPYGQLARISGGRAPGQLRSLIQGGANNQVQMFAGGGGGASGYGQSLSGQDGTISWTLQNLGGGQQSTASGFYAGNNQLGVTIQLSGQTMYEIQYTSGSNLFNFGGQQGFNGNLGPCVREMFVVVDADPRIGQGWRALVALYIAQNQQMAATNLESGFVLYYPNYWAWQY